MYETELLLRLSHLPGVGAATIRKLLLHFGEVPQIWNASPREVQATSGLKSIAHIWEDRQRFTEWERDLQLVEKMGVDLIPITSEFYPRRLLDIIDPPILLYVKGNVDLRETYSLGVVGTRQATPYGLDCAALFSSGLAKAGMVIISGLARGVDTAAHIAALKNGKTIAVIGSGLANLYPPDNKQLAEKIALNGAVISELPMTTPPDRQTFPQRNRIVSGMSKGLLLIEAPEKSGAMITMQLGQEHRKTCFAVPGRIDFPSCSGNLQLIRQGKAKLVTHPNDILNEFDDLFPSVATEKPAASRPSLSSEESQLLKSLPHGEHTLDEISRLTKVPVAKLGVLLMSLMLKNLIKEYPGKRYKRAMHE